MKCWHIAVLVWCLALVASGDPSTKTQPASAVAEIPKEATSRTAPAIAPDAGKLKPEPVLFRNGDATRHGCVYKPEGKGPFPAIVFNQSATHPTYDKIDWPPFQSLAQFFTEHGYVFFLPGRYSYADVEHSSNTAPDAKSVSKWQLEAETGSADVLAAIDWIKAQSYIDENRVVLCGHSAGAIQALIVASKKPDIRGMILFSTGAVSWNSSTKLQQTLTTAMRNTQAPVFLLQPQNDYSIQPSHVLGGILQVKGAPNKVKIFPPYGTAKAEANLFGVTGSRLWGSDVLEFLDQITK